MAEKEHIILFPSLAQGHFIPFMALAHHLAQKNAYKITFLSTPLNIHRFKSSLPPNTSISLASLPFNPTHHSLPPNIESSDAVPYQSSLRLLHASQSLQPAFQTFLSQLTTPPLTIISDIFLGWTAGVARKLGFFHAVFVVSGAYGTAVYFSLWLHLPHRNTDGSDSCSKLHQHLLPLCFNTDAFLFNTSGFVELEKMGMEYFTSKAKKPRWAIGPVVNVKRGRKEPGVSEERCISWLDLHRPGSVLCVFRLPACDLCFSDDGAGDGFGLFGGQREAFHLGN